MASASMKIVDKIWSKNAEFFLRVKHNSQERVLHPEMARLVNIQNPKNVLDFGCGDGRLINLLNKNTDVDIYDKNSEMVDIAESKLGNRIKNAYRELDDIENDKYDAVILGMVLVCIDNIDEFDTVLQKIRFAKRQTGYLYVSITHPCFREKEFSNFKTSFGSSQSFNYFEEGEPFTVKIKDDTPPGVAFTDYHWSLSFTINSFIKAGFSIEEMLELRDDNQSKKFNQNFSGFIIFKLK